MVLSWYILLVSKDISWHKYFLWWLHQNLWRTKNEKEKNEIYDKSHFSFRISKQNWNILFRSKETSIFKNNLFLLIFTFMLTSAWEYYNLSFLCVIFQEFLLSTTCVTNFMFSLYDFSIKSYQGLLNPVFCYHCIFILYLEQPHTRPACF